VLVVRSLCAGCRWDCVGTQLRWGDEVLCWSNVFFGRDNWAWEEQPYRVRGGHVTKNSLLWHPVNLVLLQMMPVDKEITQ